MERSGGSRIAGVFVVVSGIFRRVGYFFFFLFDRAERGEGGRLFARLGGLSDIHRSIDKERFFGFDADSVEMVVVLDRKLSTRVFFISCR